MAIVDKATLLFLLFVLAGATARFSQVDEEALTNQDDSADVWDDNQIVDWKDIEDEPDTFIVVSDADTENTEWSEDIENLDRSKRQEDEFEGSGDDTPILPTNSTPAEEAKAVVPPSDTAESGPPAENTADATPANEEEVSESSAPPEVAAPPPLLQAASVDVAQPSETPTAGKSRSVASGDEAKKSEGETPPAATSEENKARAAVGASASTEQTPAEGKIADSTPSKSGGGKVTLLIVAGIIIVGAAAFTYHYCKKKVAASHEPDDSKDRELVEITVNKRVDPQQEKNSVNGEQQKPLLENNRQNANSVEIQEVKEEEEEEDAKEEEQKQLKNGAGGEKQ